MAVIEKIDETRERFYRTLEHEVIPDVDPITLEIVRNRLETMANEMGAVVHSTAHTPVFAETKDFSCAMFDYEGHLIALGQFMPGHQGNMQSTIDNLIKAVGWDNINEGDIFMTNDALYGGCHPPDLMLFRPVFYKGERIGFVCSLVHHIDMGGMAPSSYCPEATELYQEGMRFPPFTKIYEAGKLRNDILQIFLTNVRKPDAQYGDLMAQIAGCHAADGWYQELAERYGAKTLKDVSIAIQYLGKKIMEKHLESMPDGVYTETDWVESDGFSEEAFPIKLTMTVKGNHLIIDYTGSAKQAKGFINSQWGNTSAHSYSAVMTMIPQAPRCYGTTVPIELIAEKGSIVNPSARAAIGSCTTESGHVVNNLVGLCCSYAKPELGSGVWSGAFGFQVLWGTNPETDEYFLGLLESPGCGGGGARKTMDGWTLACQKCSNCLAPNIEIEESTWPLIYKYRRLASAKDYPGSGAGTFRGGPGLEFELGCAVKDMPLNVTNITNKVKYGPHGVFGGHTGHGSGAEIRDRVTGEVKRVLPPKILGAPMEPDEVLYFASPGGGGYGNPLERDPEMVRVDVMDDFVTQETARDVYGVVLTEELNIDKKATEKLRKELRQKGLK